MSDKIDRDAVLRELREYLSTEDSLIAWDVEQIIHALPAAAPAEDVRAGALKEAANAIWDGPICEYGRAAQGPELQAAHKCRDAILALIPEDRT